MCRDEQRIYIYIYLFRYLGRERIAGASSNESTRPVNFRYVVRKLGWRVINVSADDVKHFGARFTDPSSVSNRPIEFTNFCFSASVGIAALPIVSG